jgi:hypothetical protein
MKGFDYKTVYNMPVMYKRWFVERLSKQKEKEMAESQGSNNSNSQDVPMFQNSPFKDINTSQPKNPSSKRFT